MLRNVASNSNRMTCNRLMVMNNSQIPFSSRVLNLCHRREDLAALPVASKWRGLSVYSLRRSLKSASSSTGSCLTEGHTTLRTFTNLLWSTGRRIWPCEVSAIFNLLTRTGRLLPSWGNKISLTEIPLSEFFWPIFMLKAKIYNINLFVLTWLNQQIFELLSHLIR